MKKRILIILSAVLSILVVSCASTKVTAEQEAAVRTNIQNRNFTVNVIRAIPTGSRNVNLTSPYSIRLEGDMVYSYLPYFGRAYNIPYGGGEGLVFEAPVSDYRVVAGKKGSQTITFTAASDAGENRFTIDVYPGGSSQVTVIPAGRQAIRYDGTLDASGR